MTKGRWGGGGIGGAEERRGKCNKAASEKTRGLSLTGIFTPLFLLSQIY